MNAKRSRRISVDMAIVITGLCILAALGCTRTSAILTAPLLLQGQACPRAGGGKQQVEESTNYLQAKPEAMQRWRDMKFGMFIRWGIYPVPDGTYRGKQIPGIGEWIMQRARIPNEKWLYRKDHRLSFRASHRSAAGGRNLLF